MLLSSLQTDEEIKDERLNYLLFDRNLDLGLDFIKWELNKCRKLFLHAYCLVENPTLNFSRNAFSTEREFFSPIYIPSETILVPHKQIDATIELGGGYLVVEDKEKST